MRSFAQHDVFIDDTALQMLSVASDTTGSFVGRLAPGIAARDRAWARTIDQRSECPTSS